MHSRRARWFILCLLLFVGQARCDDSPGEKSDQRDLKAQLPRILPTEPEHAVATFRLKPGFKIELVAAEPLIRDPVAIDFDENGRMFVVEFPEYNQKHIRQQIQGHGRVRVLDDDDGDGVYDRSTIFVDRLSYPSAIACYDGGVFVAAAPDILYCKDTDGDGKDDQRRVVFTGFGQEFQRAGQAQLNSFLWGYDHRIHVCTSFSGGLITRPDDPASKPIHVRNRGFLFDPRTLHYEAVSGGGQHGLAIDDWGREFRCRNSEPVRLLMYDERYVARNPYLEAPAPAVDILPTGKHTKLFRVSRDEPWRVVRTRMRTEGEYAGSNEGGSPFGFFTSATGITIYRGAAWPSAYRGSVLVGEVANNLIFRATLREDGVGMVANRADPKAEFLASTDNWFRPVQLANGPDGALYVVDMYRELIEGASFLPPEVLRHINVLGGVDRGRIYRIVPEDFQQPAAPPRLADATTSELVKLLGHPNGWHRDTAARLLHTRQDPRAIAPLKELAANSRLPAGRMHALYALAAADSLDESTISRGLSDKDSHVREHALRLAEPLAAGSAVVRGLMLEQCDDTDRRVRFQAAFSLGSFTGTKRDQALRKLLERDGKDPWFRLAVLSSFGTRPEALFRLLLEDVPYRNSPVGAEMLSTLAEQLGTTRREQVFTEFAALISELPEEALPLARQLIQRAATAADSDAFADVLSRQGGRAGQILADLANSAVKQVQNEQAKERSRLSAIRLVRLLPADRAVPVATGLLEVNQPQELQLAAIELLGKTDAPLVPSLLLDRWAAFTPQLRAQVVETLATRESWLLTLLDAVESERIRGTEIDNARLQLLRVHPNTSIRQRALRLTAAASVAGHRRSVVEEYQAALTLAGDIQRGKDHFRRVCSACHRLERIGTAVGADLKAIRHRGMPAILLNVLDPNREVQPQYLTYVVQTDDGRLHTGMIQSESTNSITLRRPDHTLITILRVEIEQMRSTGLSLMPEGLEKQLDVQAMADLLAYLASIE